MNKVKKKKMSQEGPGVSGRKKGGHKLKKFILWFLLGMFVLLLAGAIWFYFAYWKDWSQLRKQAVSYAVSSTPDTFRAAETSLVYDVNGELLSVLKGEKDVYYLKYEEIPVYALEAMLVTEDRKFFEHGGYDIYGIMRAARAYLINKGEIHQGGSTITQQLARIVFLTNEVSLERKITEIFLAAELEKKYSKDQILEFYMNNIYYANGYYGIQAAANGYFGRNAKELSLSELAFLCAIPNNPTIYDPVTHYDNTIARRDKVLLQMYENGVITNKEYKKAKKKKIKLVRKKIEKRDYAETYTYYCAIRALMEKNGFQFQSDFNTKEEQESYDKRYYEEYYRVQRSLYTEGYRIYTSIDLEKQELLQNAVNQVLKDYTDVNEEGIYKLQASAACIDNKTGLVAAIIGGRGQQTGGYTLNRAYQSPRQPGSAIKPLIVYTPAHERGLYPDTKVVDEKFEGGPKNSSGVYSGEITLRYAVETSKNTVAWKLFENLTPAVGLEYLKKMMFSKIVYKDYVPAASLGGLTYGATSLEMASAYAALANEGKYRQPSDIIRITDANGNEIYRNERAERLIYQRNAALMMTDILKGVISTGTAHRLALDHAIAAGKTGTTNDQKDGWFVGYTHYYTTGVWVGYDLPKPLDSLMGSTYPGYIWKAFMDQIHAELPIVDFTPYLDSRPFVTPEASGEDTSGEEGTYVTEEASADDPADQEETEDLEDTETTGNEDETEDSEATETTGNEDETEDSEASNDSSEEEDVEGTNDSSKEEEEEGSNDSSKEEEEEGSDDSLKEEEEEGSVDRSKEGDQESSNEEDQGWGDNFPNDTDVNQTLPDVNQDHFYD